MTVLYIRSIADMPHALGTENSLIPVAVCGVVLSAAEQITEAQALIFLGNRRCSDCFPGRGHHTGQMRRHAA